MNIFEKVYTNPTNGERWIKITDRIVPGIKPIYWISDFGNVYSEFSNSLMSLSLDYRGYAVLCLSLLNGRRTCKVHRLVALAFILDYRNTDLLQVNHKDGIKTNNFYWNLEWSTPKENIDHSIRMGLRTAYNENVHTSVFDNDTVLKIADLLLKNTSYKNIIDELDLTYDDATIHRIERIRSKKTWNTLLLGYDFSNYDPYHNSRVFTKEELHSICKYLEENGKQTSTEEVFRYLGKGDFYSYPTEVRASYTHALSCLKGRSKYKNISSNYNF